MIYAVKIGSEWHIAEKRTAKDYSLKLGSGEVWADAYTTEFLGYLYEAKNVVTLESTSGDDMRTG